MTEEMVLCQTGSHLLHDHDVTARFADQVEELLERITGVPVRQTNVGTEARLSSPITFSDGIGAGSLVAEVFWYRGKIRVDIHVDHNRMFAGPDGRPSERECYLSDFVASVTVGAEETLPLPFARSVRVGVKHAREAVDKHNDRYTQPWNQIHVVAAA